MIHVHPTLSRIPASKICLTLTIQYDDDGPAEEHSFATTVFDEEDRSQLADGLYEIAGATYVEEETPTMPEEHQPQKLQKLFPTFEAGRGEDRGQMCAVMDGGSEGEFVLWSDVSEAVHTLLRQKPGSGLAKALRAFVKEND